MLKAVILQSGYIPWLGFFNQIYQSDIFVFLDDVQWTRRDWRNRNRIRTPQGWAWLTVPVKLERAYYEYKICDVKIDNSQNWQESHLSKIKNFYKKAPYYCEIYPSLENILLKEYKFVIDLNYEFIFWVCEYLNITGTNFFFSQDMHIPVEIKKTERLIYILKKIGGVSTYITGLKAKSYIKVDEFRRNGINISWHDYEHPYYDQNTWGQGIFIPYLSIVDLLFCHGKDSLQILTHQKKIERPDRIQVVLPEEVGEN